MKFFDFLVFNKKKKKRSEDECLKDVIGINK